MQENLSGIHVVKAYVREEARTAKFAEMNESFKNQSMEVAKMRGKIFPFMRIVSSLGILVVLYYGGSEVVRGRLTLGDLVAFIGYLHMLAWPIMALGWMISIYQRGKAALYGSARSSTSCRRSRARPRRRRSSRAARFASRTSTFRVPGSANGRSGARDVDLSMPAGSKLGVLGRTGSGKSTLAMLLPRLFDVTAGA